MANPSIQIINALRKTAFQLKSGNRYEWGHMGSCNCGNLAQTITTFSRAEIQKYALEKRGDWSDQLVDYCPTSGYPMDMIIERMIDFGFSKQDLNQLEWLSNPEILCELGVAYLDRNLKANTILYLETWANLLEIKILDKIELPDFNIKKIEEAVLALY